MPASPTPFSGDPDWQARLSGQIAPARPTPLPGRTEWHPPAAGSPLNAPPVRASIPEGRQTFPPRPSSSAPLFTTPPNWQPGPSSLPPVVPPELVHPVALAESTAWRAPGQPAAPWSPPAQGWPAAAPAPAPGALRQPAPPALPRAEVTQPPLPRPSRAKPAKRRPALLRWVLMLLIAVLVVVAAYVYVAHAK